MTMVDVLVSVNDFIAFSMMIDSASDVAHVEELGICIRVAARDAFVEEHMSGFKEADAVIAIGLQYSKLSNRKVSASKGCCSNVRWTK